MQEYEKLVPMFQRMLELSKNSEPEENREVPLISIFRKRK